MGYMKEKYTKEYFLKEDSDGNPIGYGVEGAELFKENLGIRSIDKTILSRIDFCNKKVLEFGYGRGEAIRFAKEKGAIQVVGVDFAQDAYNLANEYLKMNGIEAELYNNDALDFIKNILSQNNCKKFDIIIMLDFIEHIPRKELQCILRELRNYLEDKAIIVINTPVFGIDNDVITEGLNPKAIDTSDAFEETAGMHCNRYTKQSLKIFMKKLGYYALSGHFFVTTFSCSFFCFTSRSLWKKALKIGFPLLPVFCKEEFEYASTAKNIVQFKKSFKMIMEKTINQTLPPFLFSILKKFYFRFLKKKSEEYQPRWHIVRGGKLKGYEIFIDAQDSLWQDEMIQGSYDSFLFNYLDKEEYKGKVVYDIGAHIGYHSMVFAHLVGTTGKVIAFEPNKENRERFLINVSRNDVLAKRITLYEAAVSDSHGFVDFYSNPNVDNGSSSGSFIYNYKGMNISKTAYMQKNYVNNVETVPLDQAKEVLGINQMPDLMKMDVEGAEALVLEGAKRLIKEKQPILFIEVHSISNMYKIYNFLTTINYSIDLVKEEKDGRCFIAAISIYDNNRKKH